MFRLAWFFPVLLLCLAFASVGYTDEKQPADNKRGSIVDGNTYNNPALAMTIKLPGTWHFLEKPVSEQPKDPSCRGPLCGTPEVNVALESRSGTAPLHGIFLAAYKLSPEYLNRQRYPLKKFAEVMLPGSMQGTGWTSQGDLNEIQLDSRPAYRLFGRNLTIESKKGFGYVCESNNYIFMLIGSAYSSPNDLQSAIENMKFDSPHN
jgi:hypothetical protein